MDATGQLLNHPFFETQLRYDHRPEAEAIPSYTRALWDRQHRRISADFARYKPAARVRVLDIGCGPGHLAESQKEHTALYMGVDPSLTELRRGKKSPSRYFVHGAAERLDFIAPNSFDIVTMISVLDHCIDWHAALRRSAEVLRPGGAMLIVMENAEQLPTRVRRWFGRETEHHDHMHFISLGDVAAALGSDFAPIVSDTFGYGFGMQAMTARLALPRQLFDVLHPVMDAIGRLLMPRSGQVLYGWYRKRPNASVERSERIFVGEEPHANAGVIEMLAGHQSTTA